MTSGWSSPASEGAEKPEELRENGRPTLLAHAGIHSGEIDGKDAGMMLLRDMTVLGKRRELLDRANLLFIPILSVDGHERFSRFGRINQRGPVGDGLAHQRPQPQPQPRLHQARDRGAAGAGRGRPRWQPDLYLDLHVTDGADYQYDITYGYNGPHAWSPQHRRLARRGVHAGDDAALEAMGPRARAADLRRQRPRHEQGGTVEWTAPPRFSNGWGDARHLPTVLVENHSLKPYRQRVLGTYVLLESAMTTLGRRVSEALREARGKDEQATPPEVVLAWDIRRADPPPTVSLQGGALRALPVADLRRPRGASGPASR